MFTPAIYKETFRRIIQAWGYHGFLQKKHLWHKTRHKFRAMIYAVTMPNFMLYYIHSLLQGHNHAMSCFPLAPTALSVLTLKSVYSLLYKICNKGMLCVAGTACTQRGFNAIVVHAMSVLHSWIIQGLCVPFWCLRTWPAYHTTPTKWCKQNDRSIFLIMPSIICQWRILFATFLTPLFMRFAKD